ncbi:MAG: DUF3078 domain-containing protein [Parafilimonas sp.]
MKKWLLFIFILLSRMVVAQDSTIRILKIEALRTIPISVPDTINKNWIKGGIFNLNIAQGTLKNWAAGGDNFSFSLNMYTNGHAFYKRGKVSWDNNIDINIGYINTTSLGTRKTDDRFDFLSKYGYALNKKISASALFDFRTQFFDGYTYSDPTTPIFSSTAFSPAYILLSPGFDYKPIKNLSIFISPISSRWVVVTNPTLSKIGSYGVDSGNKSINQLGAFGTINFNTKFTKNITFNSRMDLFSNYEHNPSNVDFYMTNLFAAKFTRLFSVTWGVDMIYDDDVRLFGPNHNSPRLQLKSLIGIGILLKMGT